MKIEKIKTCILYLKGISEIGKVQWAINECVALDSGEVSLKKMGAYTDMVIGKINFHVL